MDLSERGASAARHPWEHARSTFFRRLIADSVDLAHLERLLDIGAGDGWFAQELLADLPESTSVTCWDTYYTSDDLNALLPPRIERTLARPGGQFGCLLLMDVLEHIEHDEEFLADTVVPLLSDDGVLIFSVPAHPRLFSRHDTALGHHRRYRPAAISALLRRHLDVTSEGSLFSSLTVARLGQVAVERLGHPAAAPSEGEHGIGQWEHGSLITKAVTTVLDGDARLARVLARRNRSIPGLSYWAVCRPNR
ncbi:MAG: methyltransferase domain-containing protein [Ilumatobacteraceae bacterium]